MRVSTSKSCAARVVVSTTPGGGPVRTSGRGRARKWVEPMLMDPLGMDSEWWCAMSV